MSKLLDEVRNTLRVHPGLPHLPVAAQDALSMAYVACFNKFYAFGKVTPRCPWYLPALSP